MNLFEALIDLFENSLFVEHFPAKPMFVVVCDLLSEVTM